MGGVARCRASSLAVCDIIHSIGVGSSGWLVIDYNKHESTRVHEYTRAEKYIHRRNEVSGNFAKISDSTLLILQRSFSQHKPKLMRQNNKEDFKFFLKIKSTLFMMQRKAQHKWFSVGLFRYCVKWFITSYTTLLHILVLKFYFSPQSMIVLGFIIKPGLES